MKYEKIVHGRFIDRPNRFIAHVEIEGKLETVHVKNTGRCAELLVPNAHVILEDFRNRPEFEKRKTKFDLIAVYKVLPENHPLKNMSPLLINMDSQAPNKVVNEWLEKQDFDFVKPEFVFGKSRIDFYMIKKSVGTDLGSVGTDPKIVGTDLGSVGTDPSNLLKHENSMGTDPSNTIQNYLMEIKGCTLEKNGCGFFPDAPTERGVKHLNELTEAALNGYKCIIGFVIQMAGINQVLPNVETHKEFGEALERARKAGVQIVYFCCEVEEDSLHIVNSINFEY